VDELGSLAKGFDHEGGQPERPLVAAAAVLGGSPD
jgi:hypothetical protein